MVQPLRKRYVLALVELLREKFGIVPTTDENEVAAQTIEATSTLLESATALERIPWVDLLTALSRAGSAASAEGAGRQQPFRRAGTLRLVIFGSWPRLEEIRIRASLFATGGWHRVLLAREHPSAVFSAMPRPSRTRTAVPKADGAPRDHEDLRGPTSVVIERALAFIDRNTPAPDAGSGTQSSSS